MKRYARALIATLALLLSSGCVATTDPEDLWSEDGLELEERIGEASEPLDEADDEEVEERAEEHLDDEPPAAKMMPAPVADSDFTVKVEPDPDPWRPDRDESDEDR